MNRKKKIFTKLSAKAKKANLKANPKNKPKYISKAERAKLEAQNQEASDESGETSPNSENN